MCRRRACVGRQGEIRDRSSEGQHYRMAGLNLLAAIVIYWNTAHLGEAVRPRKHAGLTVEPELLAHISPLGWTLRISSGMTEGICKGMMQSDREFLNI